MSEKLTMKPNDYIVFNGGLKIENISVDNVITVELPETYTVEPLVVEYSPTPTTDKE